MLIALAILSVTLVALSMYGALLPHRLLGLIRKLTSGDLGLWGAVVARLLLAVLLWINAPVSLAPTTFKILAAVLILSAIAHFIVGRARLKRFLESLLSWPHWAIRLSCFLGVGMGVFILWGISAAIGAA